MFEKVNPSHPDKLADRIAGAIVDMAYLENDFPKVAAEVLIGHGVCHIIIETSENLSVKNIENAVHRIVGFPITVDCKIYKQDMILAFAQLNSVRCGDNGIFKGTCFTDEQIFLCDLAHSIYSFIPYDGKYLIDGKNVIICQSNTTLKEMSILLPAGKYDYIVNPLGNWIGGIDVDTGATNRKLGSDMGDAITGGGLHGKDLSKADVTLNIYAHLKAKTMGRDYMCSCAIGDNIIDEKPYREIVELARDYIRKIGGFEKFAEWGFYAEKLCE